MTLNTLGWVHQCKPGGHKYIGNSHLLQSVNYIGTDWRGIGLRILIGGRMKETDSDTYPNMYVDVTIN